MESVGHDSYCGTWYVLATLGEILSAIFLYLHEQQQFLQHLSGMTLWVDAFETLAMFGIVSVLHYSVSSEPKFKNTRSNAAQEDPSVDSDSFNRLEAVEALEVELDTTTSNHSNPNNPPNSVFESIKVPIQPTFNKCFTYYGLFIGVISLIGFIADVLRFVNWHLYGRIAMAIQIVVGVILLPIWLLIFARQLPVATEKFERIQRWGEIVDGERIALVDKAHAA